MNLKDYLKDYKFTIITHKEVSKVSYDTLPLSLPDRSERDEFQSLIRTLSNTILECEKLKLTSKVVQKYKFALVKQVFDIKLHPSLHKSFLQSNEEIVKDFRRILEKEAGLELKLIPEKTNNLDVSDPFKEDYKLKDWERLILSKKLVSLLKRESKEKFEEDLFETFKVTDEDDGKKFYESVINGITDNIHESSLRYLLFKGILPDLLESNKKSNKDLKNKVQGWNEGKKNTLNDTEKDEIKKYVNEFISDYCNYADKFSSNIENLISFSPLGKHVLVVSNGEVQFNQQFWEEEYLSNKKRNRPRLPGDLEEFRKEFINELEKHNSDYNQYKDRKFEVDDLPYLTLPNDKVNPQDIKGFLGNLVFAVNQYKEDELEDIVTETVAGSFRYLGGYIAHDFQIKMLDWLKYKNKENRSPFLLCKDVEGFVENAKNVMKQQSFSSITDEKVRCIIKKIEDELYIKPKNVNVKELDLFSAGDATVDYVNKFLTPSSDQANHRKNILNLAFSNSHVPWLPGILSSIKVLNLANNVNYKDKYFFLDLSHLLTFEPDSIVNVLFNPQQKVDLLVVVDDLVKKEGEDTDKIKNIFSKIYEHERDKKLILISNENDEVFWKGIFQSLGKEYEHKKDENSLDSLDIGLKDELLLKRNIKFCGKEQTKLTALIPTDKLNEVVKAEAFNEFILNGEIIIGSEPKYEFETHVPISREFKQTEIQIDVNKLNDNIDKALFYINGISREEINNSIANKEKILEVKYNNNQYLVVIGNTENKKNLGSEEELRSLTWKGLIATCDKENIIIHFLEKKSDTNSFRLYRKSRFKGSFIIPNSGGVFKRIEKPVDVFTDSNDKHIIISGKAGMGKSTILTTYSESKRDSLVWPIQINLKDYQKNIESSNFRNLNAIIDFLSNNIGLIDLKTELAKSVLRYRLEYQGKVTLLLDGYDEIKSDSQKKVVNLLNIWGTTKGKVFITTRSYEKLELENALGGMFSYDLKPFNPEKQREFLQKFWEKKLEDEEKVNLSGEQKQKIKVFTEALVEHFNKLPLMKENGLIGIVLQARMIAEVFQKGCKEYLSYNLNTEFDFSRFEVNNIFDLYERVVEKQYDRYLDKKLKVADKLHEDQGSRNSLARSYTKEYGYLAFRSLFSEDQMCEEILKDQRFSEGELKDIGLIKDFRNVDNAYFIHQTYAEYFAARLLINKLANEQNNPHKYNLVRKFLLRNIFLDRYKVIYDFIDSGVKSKNNKDLEDKWNNIKSRDLLKGIKVEKKQFFNIEERQHSSQESLELLKNEIDKCINWVGNGYYYNGDTDLISRFIQAFYNETDTKILREALKFLCKISGKSYYGKANAEFEKNLLKAFEHYFSHSPENTNCIENLKNKPEFAQFKSTLKSKNFPTQVSEEELSSYSPEEQISILYYIEQLNQDKFFRGFELCDENERQSYIEKVKQELETLDGDYTNIEKLSSLNKKVEIIQHYYNIETKNILQHISTNDGYNKKIIYFLANISCGSDGVIDENLKNTNLESLQNFFISVTHSENKIEETKSYINEIYKDKKLDWLERRGIFISRFLKILTPEISNEFNLMLDLTTKGVKTIYSRGIFIDLISYFIDTIKKEDLPQVNKLALLKMIVKFSVIEKCNSNQIEATLEKLVKIVISEKHSLIRESLSESTKYLLLLGKVGFKVVNTDKNILIIYPDENLQCELSMEHRDKVARLIKWVVENSNEVGNIDESRFAEECKNSAIEIVEEETKSKDLQQGETSMRQRSLSLSCLGSRKRRHIDNCHFSWQDIDEFNREKEHSRDKIKIEIDSDKFINYIKDESISESKRTQLIQLAGEVTVTGKSQGLVDKLISNQKFINHLSKVGMISGITMQGMIAKNVLADAVNGNYQGLAINLGFIALPFGVKAGENAALEGLQAVSKAAYARGFKLAPLVESSLAQSFRVSSSFLARSTSAFIAYDLYRSVKELRNGTEEALVGVVGDSVYLGVDAAELGIEVAEGFGVLEGVSSVTGPIGATVGAVVFVGTDVYQAVKKVENIDRLVHLTAEERFLEGIRAFIGIGTERHIEELVEEKQLYNQLVRQALEYLKQHSDIQRYVFPTGKLVQDTCNMVQYKEQCPSADLIGDLMAVQNEPTGLDIRSACNRDKNGNFFILKEREECTTKFQPDSDNTVILDEKKPDIKWSKIRPDEGSLFCIPQGHGQLAPGLSYSCNNAIGVEYVDNRTSNYTLLDLGGGTDYAKGFKESNNIFFIGNGNKTISGGEKDDTFILQGNRFEGKISGGNGTNTLDLSKFSPQSKSLFLSFRGNNLPTLGGLIDQISKVITRENKEDIISCKDVTLKYIDGRGGRNENEQDVITIEFDYCQKLIGTTIDCRDYLSGKFTPKVQIMLRDYTTVNNYASKGNFSYFVDQKKGKASVDILSTSKNDFIFNNTLENIKDINFNSSVDIRTVKFTFSPHNTEALISYRVQNISFTLKDGTVISVSKEGNLYALQNSNKSVDEIINSYSRVANNLKMSIFVHSLLNNESIVVGHGKHDVIENNPQYKSHLVGNGGENIFVVTSDKLPIPEIVLYDVDQENKIDTLDLRQIRKQVENVKVKTRVITSGKDLIIQLFYEKDNEVSESNIVQVRLKNGLLTNWYERLHVIMNHVPMKIEEFELRPLPLVFDNNEEIIRIAAEDVDKNNKIIISQKIEDYTFSKLENDLIMTFNNNASLILSEFYKNKDMETLTIRFANKEVAIKDELNNVRSFDDLKEEYRNNTANIINNFNSTEATKASVEPFSVIRRSRRDIESNVKSAASRPASFVNTIVNAFTNAIIGTVQGIISARTSAGYSTQCHIADKPSNYKNSFNGYKPESSISQVDAKMDVNGTIMLFDLLIRKVTGQKYISTVDQSISPLEAQGYALNITNRFEKVLNKTAIKSGISLTNLNLDPVAVQSAIVRKIINGRFSEIAKTLYSFAKEACPEFKQTDKFLVRLRSQLEGEKVLQQKVEKPYKDLSQEVSRKVELSKKPDTFLNGTSVVKGISRGIN